MSSGPSADETLSLVMTFDPGGNDRAAESRRLTLDLLRSVPSPFDRTTFQPGHVTTSAVVTSHDHGRVLLVYHQRLGRWLQPGGHIERGDPDVVAATRREVAEETGLELDATIRPPLVSVNVHEIPTAPGEPSHLHYDLTFGYVLAAHVTVPDRWDVVWCPTDQLDRYAIDRPLAQSVVRLAAVRHVT